MTFTEKFAGQRVLVTGTRGFVGQHLCRKLIDAGAEVFGVSRTRSEAWQGVSRWFRGNLADLSFVRATLHQVHPRFVFHLAGHVSGLREVKGVLPTFQDDLTSTVNLLLVATEMDCFRTVLSGSLEEPDEVEATPSSPYAAAKWAGAGYSRMFADLYGTSITTARLFMVYGPGQVDYHKLVPYVISSLLKGQAPQLSSGRRLVDWIYVDDVVEGLITIAQSSQPNGRSIDLGSGTCVSIREIVARIVRIVGGSGLPQFGALNDRPRERVRAADVAATYKEIGWKPRTSLDEGLARTVEWYRKVLGAEKGAGA